MPPMQNINLSKRWKNFKNRKTTMTMAYNNNIMTGEEFVGYYYLNKSKNPDFPYWKYNHFNLDTFGYTKMTSVTWLTFFKE